MLTLFNMKRETYIQIRKSNNLVLLAYNHYYEKCLEKGQNPLDFSGFAEWFPQYIGASHIVDSLVKHYDNFFEITIVQKIDVQLRVTQEIDYI